MACHRFDWTQTPAAAVRGGAVSIGNFDGVHRGHAALVSVLRQQAQAVGGPAVAVTFDPHPLQLLRPDLFQPVLTTPEDRAALLHEVGADHVLILHTTPELLQLGARDFFQKVMRDQLDARAIVEGANFGFGHNREGSIDTLRDLCAAAGLRLSVVSAFTSADGQPISSSRVRAALVSGDVQQAAELLGRPYRVRGEVATGQRRGNTLGFPTANLERLGNLVPADGVYAARTWIDGIAWPAAVNVGPNPTFGEAARKVEAHLIGFQGNLYGRDLAVDFLRRLRATRPFSGVEALVEQLHKDVEAARRCAEESRS